MSAYRLAELVNLDHSYDSILAGVKTSAVQSVASVFVSNIQRGRFIPFFPARLLNLANHFLQRWRKAKADIFGSSDLDENRYAEWVQKRADVLRVCEEIDQRNLDTIDGFPDHFQKRLDNSLYFVDAMATKTGQFLVGGIEAMLSSMVLTTWTAFEVLAGDLWKASVNAQPEYLAGLTGDAGRIERRVRGESESEADSQDDADDHFHGRPASDKTVTLSEMHKLTRGTYDIRGQLGSLLAESKKVEFTGLEAIREAYSLAFPPKLRRARSANIDTALADTAFDALSAVRNLLVHKGGVADDEYRKKTRMSAYAPKLQPQEALRLDGETVVKLVNPASQACVRLIKAVDTWLVMTQRSPSQRA
jgi:hypothetical protein